MSKVTITGLKEIQALFLKLPKRVETNATRAALRAGAKVLRDKVKEGTPRGSKKTSKKGPGYKPGNLFKSVGIVEGRKSRGYRNIDVRTRTHGSFKGFHGHLVEEGTKHYMGRKFMLKAFNSRRNVVVRIIRDVMLQRIPVEIRKLKR